MFPSSLLDDIVDVMAMLIERKRNRTEVIMKRNIRKLSALVISGALLMSGCGGTTSGRSSSDASATTQETSASSEAKESESSDTSSTGEKAPGTSDAASAGGKAPGTSDDTSTKTKAPKNPAGKASQNGTNEPAKDDNSQNDSKDTAEKSTGDIQSISAEIETSYDDAYSEADSRYLVEGYYPSISLGSYENGEFVQKDSGYPELAKAIKTYNKNKKDSFQSEMDLAKSLAEEDPRFKEEDNYGYYYSVDMEASLERSDTNIFSVLETSYSFMGGPHPNTVFTGFTVDPKTGEVLRISDVVTDKAAFIDALDKQLREDYPDIEDGLVAEDLKTAISDMYDGKDDINLQFYMTHDALVAVFSAYDITAYAYGPEFVSLYYTDSAGFLDDKYLKTTTDYAAEIPLNIPFSIETGDGKKKTLTVNSLEQAGDSEYSSEYNLLMSLDGKEYSENLDSIYGMNAYLFKKSGNAYLYLDLSSDNDWHVTQAYDINGSEIKKLDDFTEAAFYHRKPLDPSSFIMSSRGDLLSTYEIFRYYEMGDDGKPVPLTDAWWIGYDFEITLNQSLKLSVMDELTEDLRDKGTETELPKGTKLKLVRTDDRSFVDALTPDGKYARIYVDNSDWPHTVDGIDIEEAFSGIVFAG